MTYSNNYICNTIILEIDENATLITTISVHDSFDAHSTQMEVARMIKVSMKLKCNENNVKALETFDRIYDSYINLGFELDLNEITLESTYKVPKLAAFYKIDRYWF